MSTPDVFISYARKDAQVARQFAESFIRDGFDVWWDDALQTGEVFDEEIEQALRAAKAVVVLWSPHSVASRWVRAEATLADRNNTLLPVMIEPCERPIVFELLQTADLIHWRGNSEDPAWKDLSRQLRGFIGKHPSQKATPSAEPLPSLDRQSLIVLPFANLSHDEEQEYFADGIAEDVINDLGKVSAISVIARNTAFTFKGQPVDITHVARQLNVTHILEGSVRKAGNRIRVNVQLVEGMSGAQVWSERYDRDLEDIFALQDELSQAIVEALKVRFAPGERQAITDRSTRNVEVYDRYMRARSAANAAISGADYINAFDMYLEVLELDPTFSPALSGLALMLQQRAVFAPDLRSKWDYGKLMSLTEGLPNSDSATMVVKASSLRRQGRWDDALEAYNKALAGAASYESEVASLKATCLFCVGRVHDAIKVAEAARKSDPLAGFNSILLQMAYLVAGKKAEGDAEYARCQGFPVNRAVAEHVAWFRMWDHVDHDARVAQAMRHLEVAKTPLPYRAELYGLLDKPEQTGKVLERALADSATHNSTYSFLLAYHAGLMDHVDLALDALERAVSIDTAMLYGIWYPVLKSVRQTERFKALVRRCGIYDYWRETGEWGDFARPSGDADFAIIG